MEPEKVFFCTEISNRLKFHSLELDPEAGIGKGRVHDAILKMQNKGRCTVRQSLGKVIFHVSIFLFGDSIYS